MEASTHREASLEAAPTSEHEPVSLGPSLDDSWFDHPRPRSLFPKPEPGIDPLADDWFR